MSSEDRHEAVEVARKRADLSVQQLWLRYLALGGSGDAFDIDGYLQGLVPLEVFQRDVLAQAVNEALEEQYHSLQVPLSVISRDKAVDGGLAEVIDQLLAHRYGAPHPTTSEPAAPREHPRGAPGDGWPPSGRA